MPDPPQQVDCRGLVEQLYHPQTRRIARQKLVAAGAVAPLLECLDSPNESVVWAAVESLGELRATEAVAPLVELLSRGRLVLDVCEALSRISGQDFGADVGKWRKWSEEHTAGETEGLNISECLQRTAEYLGVEPSGSDNSFRFKLGLPDGRTQKVAVYFGRQDEQGDELVVVYSECGPAEPRYYETVLRKNLGIPSGAFAIRDVGGKPCFVMVDTILTALVTPGALAKRIENIARRADTIEHLLTKEDKR